MHSYVNTTDVYYTEENQNKLNRVELCADFEIMFNITKGDEN